MGTSGRGYDEYLKQPSENQLSDVAKTFSDSAKKHALKKTICSLKQEEDSLKERRERLEKELAELDAKLKFEVGKWYAHDDYILRISKKDSQGWMNYDNASHPGLVSSFHETSYKASVLRPATSEQIEQHLISLAKQKGYKGGVKLANGGFDPATGRKLRLETPFPLSDNSWMIEQGMKPLRYVEQYDGLLFGNGQSYIYCKGQWAEIIPQPSIDELRRKFLNLI